MYCRVRSKRRAALRRSMADSLARVRSGGETLSRLPVLTLTKWNCVSWSIGFFPGAKHVQRYEPTVVGGETLIRNTWWPTGKGGREYTLITD